MFAGAGGLSLGLERAGLECALHVEIDRAARCVLRARWPNTPLLSDVVAISGGRRMKRWMQARYAGVDLVSGGSPCQDLSVAGRRLGMAGKRSSLFFRQVRIWKILGADLFLWENVDGARSSNEGKDFGEVLRAIVGAAVPVPSDGWRSAGVAAGPTGVAAWRVLDAQYFGVPQRRRRVFVLGTRTGSVDPAEILSLTESVCRDSEESGEAGEGLAAAVDAGATIPLLEPGKRTGASTTDLRVGSGIGGAGDPMYTLQAGAQHGVYNPRPSTLNVRYERTDPLRASTVPAVLAFNSKQDGTDADTIAPSLLAMPHEHSHPNGGGQLAVCVTGDTTHALTSDGSDGSEDGTGRGTPVVLAVDFAQITNKDNRSQPQPQPLSPTLNAKGDVHVFNETGHEKWVEEDVAGSLNAHEAREAREAHTAILGTLNGSQRQQVDGAMAAQEGIPRRLTPRECERLMDWPDDHTLVLDGKGKPLSDAARYRMIGNGVASCVAQWIGWRLMEVA